jgi:hypothetical protein
MRAIQAALTDIIATKQLPHSFLPQSQDRDGNHHLSATSLNEGNFSDEEAEGSVDTEQGTF